MQIKPANRIGKVEEYYFSKKLREIAQLNAQGADIINLGIGSPDLPPAEAVQSRLASEVRNPKSHGYQSYTGIPELRNAMAQWYDKYYGVTLDPTGEILPLFGSKEGVMHISMAFLNPGDKVLVPNPGYPTYSSASRLAGAEIIYYPLREENGWHPDFDELEKMDLKEVKLLWCNYPNMPTGANGSIELFEKLVSFGRRHNIVICHDNPYSFILNDNPLSILSIDGSKDICIELNSMSKTFNMPGWRIGMACANKQFIEWILRVKSNMDSGMFKPMQLAAVEALNLSEAWYSEMSHVYKKRRVLAKEIMKAIGVEVCDNQIGMFLWGKIRNDNLRSEALSEQILQDNRVFLTPGFIFGSQGDNYMRISLCCNEATLEEALKRITNK